MNALSALERKILDFLSRVLSRNVFLGRIIDALITKVNTVATTTVSGIVELATEEEAVAGTDTNRAVTPKGLSEAISSQPKPFLEWIAYVTQSGKNAPEMTVIKDDTADQPVPFAPTLMRMDAGYPSFFDNGPWLDPGPNEPVRYVIPDVVSVTGMVSGDTDLPFTRLPILGAVTTGGFGFGMVSPTTMTGVDVWQAYVSFKFFINNEEV